MLFVVYYLHCDT